ncbi:MAG: site-specific DNA-methyltransferase [Nanoarchaeota archaeon]
MLELNKIYNLSWQEGLSQIDDNSIDLIIIDPPYLTTSEKWDKQEQVNEELSKQLFRVAKDNCSLYVWCGIGEKSQSLIRWFPIFNKDWFFKDLITWKKQRGIGMRKGWLYTREEIMWFVKDNHSFTWNIKLQYTDELRINLLNYAKAKSNYKRITNVWTDINESTLQGGAGNSECKLHFTPKPIKALERIIKLHTKENDLILDTFMGSGSTALVAKNLNRQFIGFENNEEYYKIACNRIDQHV